MTGAGLPVLLGTGSREYEDMQSLFERADRVRAGWDGRPLLVFHGKAKGFDRALDLWAVQHWRDRVSVRRFAADWSGPAGLGAGNERNQAMVDELADVEEKYALIGLHPGARNHGTLDCAARILTADIPWEAWWGSTALTPPRPIGLTELEMLIEDAERAKEARRQTKRRADRAAQNAWMEALDV